MTGTEPRSQLRERETGRFIHEWTVIGASGSSPEVHECGHCGKVKAFHIDKVKVYKNREAARQAGEVFFEGY